MKPEENDSSDHVRKIIGKFMKEEGLIPEGYSFGTNFSRSDDDERDINSVVKSYEDRGFSVLVLTGRAINIDGEPIGSDAILIKRKKEDS